MHFFFKEPTIFHLQNCLYFLGSKTKMTQKKKKKPNGVAFVSTICKKDLCADFAGCKSIQCHLKEKIIDHRY